jgi:hypothetical protein
MSELLVYANGSQVGHVADAAQDGGGARLPRKVDGEPRVVLHAHHRARRFVAHQRRDQRAGHLEALLEREHRRLVRIAPDGQDDLVEEAAGTTEHIEVSERDRIERSRVDGEMVGHGC